MVAPRVYRFKVLYEPDRADAGFVTMTLRQRFGDRARDRQRRPGAKILPDARPDLLDQPASSVHIRNARSTDEQHVWRARAVVSSVCGRMSEGAAPSAMGGVLITVSRLYMGRARLIFEFRVTIVGGSAAGQRCGATRCSLTATVLDSDVNAAICDDCMVGAAHSVGLGRSPGYTAPPG